MLFSTRINKRKQPDMIPLVSVIFLLLIFFLIAGTPVSPSYLDIAIPESTNDDKINVKNFKIYLDKAGRLGFEHRAIDINELKKIIANKKAGINIQVHADKEVNSLKLITLLDMLGSTLANKVILVTEERKQENPASNEPTNGK